MKALHIFLLVLLLNISGCVIPRSNAENIASSASDPSDGAITVNASEEMETTIALAECKTEYNEKSSGRAHNIKLAASKIDGILIEPGETFSYNEAVGPTGKSNGFKKARIFVRGQDAEGYGGGVCQVSSAIYSCALDLGLEITERHPHSKPVGYVPADRDAATSYGGIDLKFVNTLDKSIIITATAGDGILNVNIIA